MSKSIERRKRVTDIAVQMIGETEGGALTLDDLTDALGIVFPRMKLSNARVGQMMKGCVGIEREVVIVNRSRTTLYRLSIPIAE